MQKNNHFIQANRFRFSYPRLICALSFVILLGTLSVGVFGQAAIPILNLYPEILRDSKGGTNASFNENQIKIERFDERLLIITPNDLWMTNKDGGQIKRIEGIKPESFVVKVFDDFFFVEAQGSLWKVDKEGTPTFIQSVANASWQNIAACGKSVIASAMPFSRAAELPNEWAIDANNKSKLIDKKLIAVEGLNNQCFLGTDNGLWKIDSNNNLVEIPGIGSVINFAIFNGELYVGAENGLFIIDKEGRKVKQFEGLTRVFIEKIFADVFFVSDARGLYIINKDRSIKSVADVSTGNNDIIAFKDKYVTLDSSGFWIITDGKATKIPEIRFFTLAEVFGEYLYIGNEQGLWIIDKTGKVTPSANIKLEVSSISEIVNEKLFIGTSKGLWLIEKDLSEHQVEGVEGEVSSILLFKDKLFVSTTVGLWVLDTDGKLIKKIESIKDSMKVGSNNVFSNRDFNKLSLTGKYVYIKTAERIYRIDPDLSIKSELTGSGSWAQAINFIFPSNVLPTGETKAEACYSYDNKECEQYYNKIIPKDFSFAKMPNKFSTQGDFRYSIGFLGNYDVKYWVTDTFGNTFLIENKSYYGIPSQYLLGILAVVVPICLVLLCLALAPKIGICHSAIMNPWLRKVCSLGIVPLLLSVSGKLRRHILRRYSEEVGKDKDFTQWKDRFVYPDKEFFPEDFGKKLESERRLLFTGQSGIGKTSYFKHLTAAYVSQDKPSSPAKVFPVYIPLTNYGGNSLEDLVYNQLFSYGKITDKELAPMFLEQGGLLIFFDGVNEVQNVSDRQKLSEFVEKYWTSNYICLSSQQNYPETENIPEVKLKAFSREKVLELIRKRVNDKEKAENVIKNMEDEDFQLYSIARDLEFAVEILNKGATTLPKSRTELYKTTFNSIFDKWQGNGNADAEYMLCEHAYEMLTRRDLSFDSIDNPKFKEITTDLSEQKFLIRREKNYNFRHDLIRAYLASEHFYPRWQSLFEKLEKLNDKPIDSNWLEMLKFSCEKIEDPDEIKHLFDEVLERTLRKDMVERLFKWLKTSYPHKCVSWEKDFYTRYGELDFKQI